MYNKSTIIQRAMVWLFVAMLNMPHILGAAHLVIHQHQHHVCAINGAHLHETHNNCYWGDVDYLPVFYTYGHTIEINDKPSYYVVPQGGYTSSFLSNIFYALRNKAPPAIVV
jgi:hypothetical protein